MNNLISDTQLIEYNHLGLIPGPQESEEEFLNRAHYCLDLKKTLLNELGQNIPFVQESPAENEILQPAFQAIKKNYDFEPHWIPLFFSNYRLSPWHGGCAWNFQITENSPLGSLLQLRKNFRQSKNYLGIYNRDEIIAHEISHVGRMAFNEPKFEEVFAYNTTHSRFRRWFGPIMQSGKESMLFVLVLLIAFFADISILSTGYYEYYSLVLWLKMIPIGMILFALWRLWRKHTVFSKCYENLTTFLKDPAKANHVLYRLTDQEIIDFSKMSYEEIGKYVEKEKKISLRWKVITIASQPPLRFS